jgi:ATP-dependent helicase/nuclease subunit A
LRKAFDHHVGIKRGSCSDHDYETIKSRSKLLLATLNETPGFLEALCRIKQLPNPHYNEEQWQALRALFLILPLLVAHLQLVFNQHNHVDFTAISQQALDALGSDENPTDLALHLDNAIHHLLVDEFQDTSIQQFQ